MEVDTMSEHEMPQGGLQLNRKVGQGFHIFVEGIEIRVELRSVKPGSAKIAVIADPKKVVIRREEQLKRDE